jgi:DNA-binding NarL/FixJ family response regulator
MSIAAMPVYQAEVPTHAQRIVIVDDHPIVIEALAARILASWPGSRVVYAGNSVRDAIHAAITHGCDCAIVDVDLDASKPAIEIISAFTMHRIPLVALAQNASTQEREAALTIGARAYVAKQADPADIGRAVSDVLAGRNWVPDGVTKASTSRQATVELSAQERRALILYASGLTQDMVARRMGIASSTVKHYVDRVRQKYSQVGIPARTKLELHALARREGFLP